MSSKKDQPVMDVFPWPDGRGFAGSHHWWEYVLSQDEEFRLDTLMLLAQMDGTIRDRLLQHKDDAILEAFELTKETQTWLRGVQVDTLVEFAQAIVTRRNLDSAS